MEFRIGVNLGDVMVDGVHLYQLGELARLFQEKATGIAIRPPGRIGGITPWRRVAESHRGTTYPYAVTCFRSARPPARINPNGYLVECVPRSADILQ